MATGFTDRFRGKIKAHVLHLGSGGIVDSVTGVASKLRAAFRQAMTVTATANTDFTVSLPAGATILAATVYTTTAFGAATDAKISIGTSAGDQTYVAQTSIKAAGAVALAFAATTGAAAAMLALPAAPNLFVRIVQTGTASATGAATLVIDYLVA